MEISLAFSEDFLLATQQIFHSSESVRECRPGFEDGKAEKLKVE
jgi:hypothetical protein